MWGIGHLVSLRAVHGPGQLNGGADLLSRGGPQVREWRLHPGVIAQIWEHFGKCQSGSFCTGGERSVTCMAQDLAVCCI